MYGYKVRVYYRDIPRVCTNCYEAGHLRKAYKNVNKPWLHHVVDFITDNENICEEDFGNWMRKSREYVRDNPEIFNCPDANNELDLGDLNIDVDTESQASESSDPMSSDHEDSTLTDQREQLSSPKIITNDPIASVSHMVDSLEARSKKPDPKTFPTKEIEKEKKSRGRPKNNPPSDVTKTKLTK